jgi:enoyl-CoA hydratase
MTDPEYRYLTYESVDEGTIVRIMLNRPDARNAQNRGLLVELGAAFARAAKNLVGAADTAG